MGQYGALGNGTYVQAQGTPVKVKVLSGNIMCTRGLHPPSLFARSTLLWQLMNKPIGQKPFGPRHLVFRPRDTHSLLSRVVMTSWRGERMDHTN